MGGGGRGEWKMIMEAIYEFTYTRDQVIALAKNYKSNSHFKSGHPISKALRVTLHHFGTPSPRDMASWCELAESIQSIDQDDKAQLFLPPAVIEWIREGLGLQATQK